jgi:hypothetical protein
MIPPDGTFLAQVRNGTVQLPPPVKEYCESVGWSLFRFSVLDHDHLKIVPVLPMQTDEFHASLEPDGRLWIPAEMRKSIALGEQSVMLRIEDACIRMYIRRVFETLGFRPV